jgi:hypothetical protein
MPRRSGGGFYGCCGELRFGAEPIIKVMAVFTAAIYIECICPKADLLLKVSVGCDICRLRFGGFWVHVKHSFLVLGGPSRTHPSECSDAARL